MNGETTTPAGQTPPPLAAGSAAASAPPGKGGPVPRLGVRQRRFVEEYLVDMSPVRAVERAGYASERAARTAARLLDTPSVRLAVEQAMRQRAARTEVTQDLVVRELAAVGFTVMTDLCHWSDDGVRLRDSTQLTRAQAAAVAEVREGSTSRPPRAARGTQAEQPEASARGGVQVKLHSKLKALEMLARHLGMFGPSAGTEGGAPSGDEPLPELPAELRTRIENLYPGLAPGNRCADGWQEAENREDVPDDKDSECGEDDGTDEDDGFDLPGHHAY